MQGAKAAAPLPLSQENRRFQRVRVNLLGRYMLPNRHEYPCQVVEMSPGGAQFVAPASGEVGDRVIAYLDHVGRVEGEISRVLDGGFAITINATQRKRDKLAAQLTWLANRAELGLPEDRRHARLIPRNPYAEITLSDGRTYRCRIIDLSLSGAAIECEVRPEPGSRVMIGPVVGIIVREMENGVAIEFSTVQSLQSLTEEFGQIN